MLQVLRCAQAHDKHKNGIGGRKAASLFKRQERGRVKHKYPHSRKVVFDCCISSLVPWDFVSCLFEVGTWFGVGVTLWSYLYDVTLVTTRRCFVSQDAPCLNQTDITTAVGASLPVPVGTSTRLQRPSLPDGAVPLDYTVVWPTLRTGGKYFLRSSQQIVKSDEETNEDRPKGRQTCRKRDNACQWNKKEVNRYHHDETCGHPHRPKSLQSRISNIMEEDVL